MSHTHILDATLRTLSPDRYFWIACGLLIVITIIGMAFIGLGAWLDCRDDQRAEGNGEC